MFAFNVDVVSGVDLSLLRFGPLLNVWFVLPKPETSLEQEYAGGGPFL